MKAEAIQNLLNGATGIYCAEDSHPATAAIAF
jgi:hypothetical protein